MKPHFVESFKTRTFSL